MELIWFIRELGKRWRVLLIVPLVAVLATYLLTLKIPKVYKASGQLAAGIVDDTQASLDATKELISSYAVQTKFSNLIELIESEKVYNLVSYRLLNHELTDKEPFRMTQQQAAQISEKEKSQLIEMLNKYMETGASLDLDSAPARMARRLIVELKFDEEDLNKAIKVERETNSDFIKVEGEAESAQLAAFMANTMCEQFLKFYVDLKREKNNAVIDLFEKMAREKKAELDIKVEELKNYKMSNKIINLYEQTKSIVNQIANVEIIRENENQKIPALTNAIREIEKRFTSKEKSFIESGLIPFNERIALIKEKIAELNFRLISSNYTDGAVRDSLSKAKAELYELVKKVSDNMLVDPNVSKQDLVTKKITYELDREIAVKSVESIDKELRRLKNIVEGYTPSEAMISSYDREINVIAEAYLVILNKLTYARLEAENAGESVQITQRATPPEKAEPSKRLLLIIIAGMASFVFTIVLIILLLYLDLTIKTPKQFVQRSGLELLGIMNKMSSDKLDLRTLFGNEAKSQDETIFQNLLRTFRQHFTEKAPAKGVILFTGNHGGEGKTTLMICLAFSLRLIGKKVLLVDTNFKSPGITKIFNAKPALESAAAGDITVEDSISKTSLKEIDVVGCSGLNTTPAEIGGAKTLSDILNQLKTSYDYIFIEGGSMLRYSDSKELIRDCDAIVLVYGASTTIQEDDLNAFLYLKSYQGKFLGAVLNRIQPENLEGLYGEIDKKRSGTRKFIKNLIRRNLTRLTNGKMKISAE